mmetsp:Transcript_3380/g.5371  ORF Transcript_3380/g.5371 Transcript_3380/m.5371 type:complete len:222 (-) Transcript_3380:39-704(-)
MGCCCSCGGGDGEEATKEQEMAAQQQAAKSLVVSAKMSAPTVKITTAVDDDNNGGGGSSSSVLVGHGLALIGAALEQDAAYWEWHITLPARKHVDTILFGVSSQKDRKFYQELKEGEEQEEGVSSEEAGTNWMRKVEVQNGDVVGVAIQQSDLPMVQFFHNGEPLHELAVNRFRGTVYPSICLPKSTEEILKVKPVMVEEKFQHMSPAAKFGPIIVARSIV